MSFVPIKDDLRFRLLLQNVLNLGKLLLNFIMKIIYWCESSAHLITSVLKKILEFSCVEVLADFESKLVY